MRSAAGLPVHIYDNKGYGRARGLEFRLLKRHHNYTSGNLTYTIQWAKGYSSSAFEDYIRSLNNFPNPIRERRTDWDIRHQIVFQGNITVPKNNPLSIIGIKLPANWNATILSNFSSGYPYTPGSTNQIELQKKENNESGPITMTIDIKFRKWFEMENLIKISLMVDIFNVFDINNVNIGYGFNPWTGEPFKYGDNIENTNELYNWYRMYNLLDSRQFSFGRYAKIGLKIEW